MLAEAIKREANRIKIKYQTNDPYEVCRAMNITVSTAPIVIIPLLKEHYVMLRRNLLYTAISRAKEKVILIGHRQAVFTAIHKCDVDKRNTVLADRIVAYYDREKQRRAV